MHATCDIVGDGDNLDGAEYSGTCNVIHLWSGGDESDQDNFTPQPTLFDFKTMEDIIRYCQYLITTFKSIPDIICQLVP